MKKYELTNEIKMVGEPAVEARRIRYLKTVGKKVKSGTLGGFIQNESILNQADDSLVLDDAVVIGTSVISDNSLVKENAIVIDSKLKNNAVVSGTSRLIKSSISGATYVESCILVNTVIIGEANILESKLDGIFVHDQVKIEASELQGEKVHLSNSAVVEFVKMIDVSDVVIEDKAQVENVIFNKAKYVKIQGNAYVYGQDNLVEIQGEEIIISDSSSVIATYPGAPLGITGKIVSISDEAEISGHILIDGSVYISEFVKINSEFDEMLILKDVQVDGDYIHKPS